MKKYTVLLLALLVGEFLLGCMQATNQSPTAGILNQNPVSPIFGTASVVLDSTSNYPLDNLATSADRLMPAPKWKHADDARTAYPGNPAQITVTKIDSFGQQEGGGTWSIWVSADVRDVFSRPVADRYSVTFSVTPVSIAYAGLNAATGNSGPNNMSVPGVAFTRLGYQGQNSFDTVVVTASVNTRDALGRLYVLSNSLRFALPLQQPSLQLNVTPNACLFLRPYTSPYRATVWASVRDGYGLLVHNAPVTLHTSHGLFYRTMEDAQNSINGRNPIHVQTGGQGDPNGAGSATAYLSIHFQEIFPDTTVSEATNEVQASIDGYPNVPQVRVEMIFQRN